MAPIYSKHVSAEATVGDAQLRDALRLEAWPGTCPLSIASIAERVGRYKTYNRLSWSSASMCNDLFQLDAKAIFDFMCEIDERSHAWHFKGVLSSEAISAKLQDYIRLYSDCGEMLEEPFRLPDNFELAMIYALSLIIDYDNTPVCIPQDEFPKSIFLPASPGLDGVAIIYTDSNLTFGVGFYMPPVRPGVDGDNAKMHRNNEILSEEQRGQFDGHFMPLPIVVYNGVSVVYNKDRLQSFRGLSVENYEKIPSVRQTQQYLDQKIPNPTSNDSETLYFQWMRHLIELCVVDDLLADRGLENFHDGPGLDYHTVLKAFCDYCNDRNKNTFKWCRIPRTWLHYGSIYLLIAEMDDIGQMYEGPIPWTEEFWTTHGVPHNYSRCHIDDDFEQWEYQPPAYQNEDKEETRVATVSIRCLPISLSRTEPPPLPDGYILGEKVFYTGETKTFDNGETLNNYQSGVVVGHASKESSHFGKSVHVHFVDSQIFRSILLTELRREKPRGWIASYMADLALINDFISTEKALTTRALTLWNADELPGATAIDGYRTGEHVFFIGPTQMLKTGHKITHGQSGVVKGFTTVGNSNTGALCVVFSVSSVGLNAYHAVFSQLRDLLIDTIVVGIDRLGDESCSRIVQKRRRRDVGVRLTSRIGAYIGPVERFWRDLTAAKAPINWDGSDAKTRAEAAAVTADLDFT